MIFYTLLTRGNYRVLKFVPNNTTGTLIAGVTGSSGADLNQFSTTIRYLYVPDTYNNRIMYWANGSSTSILVADNGTYGTTLNQMAYPYGIWPDSNSNMHIAEYQYHRVTKWASSAPSGILLAGTGTSGATPDKLTTPVGLYYDENRQTLYVSNSGSSAYTVMK
ncbi:hypothetical protein I4U23_004083 [Adineta vaga]|nr:hypothetical protein I4U23_004083 [Adineta vaga]